MALLVSSVRFIVDLLESPTARGGNARPRAAARFLRGLWGMRPPFTALVVAFYANAVRVCAPAASAAESLTMYDECRAFADLPASHSFCHVMWNDWKKS